MMIFSHVKITCYLHMWRYQIFVQKLTWYFIGVYIIKWCTWYKQSSPDFKDIVFTKSLHPIFGPFWSKNKTIPLSSFFVKMFFDMMIGDKHDIRQYSPGQKDIAFTKSLYLILVKNLKNSSLLIHFRQNSPRNDVCWLFAGYKCIDFIKSPYWVLEKVQKKRRKDFWFIYSRYTSFFEHRKYEGTGSGKMSDVYCFCELRLGIFVYSEKF